MTDVQLRRASFTTTPRPILLILAGTAIVALPISWAIATYLEGFDVPDVPRVLIGLLVVPTTFVALLVITSVVAGLGDRRQLSQAGLTRRYTEDVNPAAMAKAAHQIQMLDRSVLQRVIGIGGTVHAQEISVEFISVEFRELGGAVSIRASGANQVFRPAPGAHFAFPDLGMTDDVGTEYHVFPAGGGGGEDQMQYEFRFVPAIAAEATSLTLAIHDFAARWPLPTADVPAVDSARNSPWRVDVDLVLP